MAGAVTAYLEGGAVHIESTASVSVPVTGTSIGSAYGPVRSGWVPVSPTGQVTIAVP